MLDMISELQSERMDSQRAELRPPVRKPTKPNTKGTSLPGLRPQQTTSTKPEDDFLDMIARVQVPLIAINVLIVQMFLMHSRIEI